MASESPPRPCSSSGEGRVPSDPPQVRDPGKDKLIHGFLKALKVTFKTSSIYQPDHPAFHQAVTGLMEKFDSLCERLSPVSIGFSPHSVLMDGRFWDDDPISAELGRHFHLRKIKGLVLHRGLTLAELTRFAAGLAIPLSEFIKGGGAIRLVQQERIEHIELEVLSYAQLLRGEGEEIKDLWPYLLMEAVEEDDREKLALVAEGFDKAVGKFNTEELVQNEELQKNFVKFFGYLRESSEAKYRSCARDLLKSILKNKKTSRESKFENLKLLVSDLTEDDLASTLWEEIIGNDSFDSMSFSIFSKLVSKERHLKISTSLRDLFQSENPANRRADVERKLKTLLKGTSGQMISEVYGEMLKSLLTELDFEKKIKLDRHGLQTNYRYLLLNLLARPETAGRTGPTLDRISEEWEHIAQDRDLDYLTCLQAVLRGRRAEGAAEPAYERIAHQLSDRVETWILEGGASPGLDALIQGLEKSLFEPPTYLDAIFKARVVTSTILRAYLTFFGTGLTEFKERLERFASASDLLEKIAWGLRSIDTPASLEVLKSIYDVGDTGVKVQALLAMQGLTEYDEPFLFDVLDARDMRLKAEALVLLGRHPRARHVALSKLLGLQSPYGTRNRRLVRNIRMVESRKIRDAEEFMENLSRRRDFWNRRVRREALRVLEKWRER